MYKRSRKSDTRVKLTRDDQLYTHTHIYICIDVSERDVCEMEYLGFYFFIFKRAFLTNNLFIPMSCLFNSKCRCVAAI